MELLIEEGLEEPLVSRGRARKRKMNLNIDVQIKGHFDPKEVTSFDGNPGSPSPHFSQPKKRKMSSRSEQSQDDHPSVEILTPWQTVIKSAKARFMENGNKTLIEVLMREIATILWQFESFGLLQLFLKFRLNPTTNG